VVGGEEVLLQLGHEEDAGQCERNTMPIDESGAVNSAISDGFGDGIVAECNTVGWELAIVV
jgi:hypothetical protein